LQAEGSELSSAPTSVVEDSSSAYHHQSTRRREKRRVVPTNDEVAVSHLVTGTMMNKRELIRALAGRTGLTVARAADVLDALFGIEEGIIPVAVRSGEPVQITGFGRFARRERQARTGRDPRTGTEISIAATVSTAFRPARGLREAVLGHQRGMRREPVMRGGRRGSHATSSTGPRKTGTPVWRGGGMR
jgi:nucleoid DNA-binding protein